MSIIGVLWFVVVLVVIVTVHEFGHYLVGRWTGIKADVFSVGFGRPIWSRTDRHGTRWQVAALPLGGYVKFRGDADAASRPGDVSSLAPEDRRATMAGAPLWARSATVLAGPMANFVLAFVIFMAMILWQGLAVEEAKVGTVQAYPGAEVLKTGDLVTSLDGQKVTDLESFYAAATSLGDKAELTWGLMRDGQALEVTAPNPLPPLVDQVQPQSAAMDAGMKAGDVILKAGGQDIASFGQLPDIVAATEGAPIALTVWREGDTFELTMTPRRRDLPLPEGGFETRWMIGLSAAPLIAPQTRTPGVFEAASLAFSQGVRVIQMNLEGLAWMVMGKISTCNVSSPVGMAGVVSAAVQDGALTFFQTMAMLSLAIGFANLLPIPVLDGGHLVFHLYEGIMRRPPSDGALRVLMTLGLAILIAAMLFGFSNDLLRCS